MIHSKETGIYLAMTKYILSMVRKSFTNPLQINNVTALRVAITIIIANITTTIKSESFPSFYVVVKF